MDDDQAGSVALRWRAKAAKANLLRLDKPPPSTPPAHAVEACGVSLAYLEELAATVKAMQEDYEMPESTEDIVQQLLIPALNNGKAVSNSKIRLVRVFCPCQVVTLGY